MRRTGLLFVRWALAAAAGGLALQRAPGAAPAIFPLPQEFAAVDVRMALDDTVEVLLPLEPTAHDLLLAREITAELVDRHGVAPRTRRVARVPAAGRVIVIGTAENPLVRQLAAERSLAVTAGNPGPEGYVLHVDERVALVAGSDERGAFYGLQSLRQLIERTPAAVSLRGAKVRDWAHKPFRGIRLYLPGPDNLGFFKRFVRDFMALHKFNQLIVEMNASMRLDRHPELNAGARDLARDLIHTRRDRPFGPKGEGQDSVHHDNADGAILEKREVAELVQWARQYHIEVTPEIPSLTHSYYLVTRRRDIAEMRDAEWPDAYCPSNPKSRELLFEVLEEYLEVMQPKMVHIGHDEWRVRLGACERCRDRDTRELFAEDVSAIHAWLAGRGVATMMWGDHLIERLRGKVAYDMKTEKGFAYQRPGGLSAEIVQARIPKDILVANWFWNDALTGQGEVNDRDLTAWGFRQFYGNMEPHIPNWARRSAPSSVIGGAASFWAATTELTVGKDQIFDVLGCANLLWSKHWPALPEVTAIAQALMPAVRERLSGRRAFSTFGDPQAAVKLGADGGGVSAVRFVSGDVKFELDRAAAPLRATPGSPAPAIAIGADVSSLVFLHAAEKRAANGMSYRIVHNPDDTADLLGHYEVRYADGLVLTVPLRYGVNLMDQAWTPESRSGTHCHLADPVQIAPGETFFAFEWPNPRLGKPIASVTLHSSAGFVTGRGTPLPANAVLLKAITMVKPRPLGRGQRVTAEDLDN